MRLLELWTAWRDRRMFKAEGEWIRWQRRRQVRR